MNATLNTKLGSLWNEADRLISILRSWGIGYLVGDGHSPDDLATADQLSPVALVQRLARCEYPRVRDASISLFLLHSEFAESVLEALQTSEPDVATQIVTLALATLYLQQQWSLRLTMALGHTPCFPEQPFASLWQSRHLPPPACHNGEWGLRALQETEQRRSGLSLNYMSDWQNQVDHLLLQEEAYHRPSTISTIQLLAVEEEYEQEFEMSMRPNVDKGQIENFLKNLARVFRKPGRIYLVGGAALVHLGVRPGSTQDIAIEVCATDEDEMLDSIRQLKDTMSINVELASPRDFIPLPKQWEMNARYIGRYGTIDVFYFDFYSIALSKMQRGSTRDVNDVKLLVQQGIITLQELDAAYQEVLPQVGKRPYNRLDPKQFTTRYVAVRQLL